MAETGSLQYLTQDSGNSKAGLYYFDGTNFHRVIASDELDAQYPQITLVQGTGIHFDWNNTTKQLTISTT